MVIADVEGAGIPALAVKTRTRLQDAPMTRLLGLIAALLALALPVTTSTPPRAG